MQTKSRSYQSGRRKIEIERGVHDKELSFRYNTLHTVQTDTSVSSTLFVLTIILLVFFAFDHDIIKYFFENVMLLNWKSKPRWHTQVRKLVEGQNDDGRLLHSIHW